MRRGLQLALALLLVLILTGCGGLRYSRLAPDLENFHPERIGLLPVDESAFCEAGGIADDVIAKMLVKTGWYSGVISSEPMRDELASKDDLRRGVVDYMEKLDKVNYSDPCLSQIIGEAFGIDAFLVVTVDFWNYTIDDDDDRIAKVGFTMQFVEASTGRVVWKAVHHEVEDYLIFKPDLTRLAEKVTDTMIEYMPH